MIIKLTDEDLDKAQGLASARWQLSRASGVINQRKDKRSDEDIDFLGIKGEIAVAKLFDIKVTFSGIDTGIDLWWYGIGIDVKTTFHDSGHLLFKSKDAVKAPVLIMATEYSENKIRIPGWVKRKEFIENSKQRDFAPDAWSMPQEELHDIRDFWYKVKQMRLGGEKENA